MKPSRRYERFEPVTVRAAARVVQMGQRGRVAPWEVVRYLQDLLLLDAHAGKRGMRALKRIATWRSAFGQAGVAAASRSRAGRGVQLPPPVREPVAVEAL